MSYVMLVPSSARAMPVLGHRPHWLGPRAAEWLPSLPHSCFVTVDMPSHQWLYLTLIIATRLHPNPHPDPHPVPDQAVDFSSLTLDLLQMCLMSWTLGWPQLPPVSMLCSLAQGLCYQAEILALQSSQSLLCPDNQALVTLSGFILNGDNGLPTLVLSWENLRAKLSCITLL